MVRTTVDRAKDQIILQANLSTEGAEKKKTLAQYIDEALEQEFPEDKSGDGKNYNATAKQDDVRALQAACTPSCVLWAGMPACEQGVWGVAARQGR